MTTPTASPRGYLLWAAAIALLAGCGSGGDESAPDGGAAATEAAPGSGEAPTITPDAGLMFTYLDDAGRFKVAQKVADIPEGRRKVVRVQDPTRPPADPGQVWVADLSTPQKSWRARSIARKAFEKLAKRSRPQPTKEPAGVESTNGTKTGDSAQPGPRVVMYMTNTCPVCRTARSWLNKQGVSFVERNIQRDPAAARALQEKARAKGVSARGVPVFEIGDQLIPGFDKRRLTKALGR